MLRRNRNIHKEAGLEIYENGNGMTNLLQKAGTTNRARFGSLLLLINNEQMFGKIKAYYCDHNSGLTDNEMSDFDNTFTCLGEAVANMETYRILGNDLLTSLQDVKKQLAEIWHNIRGHSEILAEHTSDTLELSDTRQ